MSITDFTDCPECGGYRTVISFDVGYKADVLKCIKCQKVIKVYPKSWPPEEV